MSYYKCVQHPAIETTRFRSGYFLFNMIRTANLRVSNPSILRACDACRRRKVRCDDGTRPCQGCNSSRLRCTYDGSSKKRGPKRGITGYVISMLRENHLVSPVLALTSRLLLTNVIEFCAESFLKKFILWCRFSIVSILISKSLNSSDPEKVIVSFYLCVYLLWFSRVL